MGAGGNSDRRLRVVQGSADPMRDANVADSTHGPTGLLAIAATLAGRVIRTATPDLSKLPGQPGFGLVTTMATLPLDMVGMLIDSRRRGLVMFRDSVEALSHRSSER